MTAKQLLILGGTAEAAALARGALARFGDGLQVTTSLAGRTERPGPLPGQIRIGGFGGPPGLAAYLTEHGVGERGRLSGAAQNQKLLRRHPPTRGIG